MCVAALAVSAPHLENPSLLIACALSSLLPLARSWRCGTLPNAPALDRALLATSGLVEVIVVILAIRVWRGFGWRVYKVVGGDIALNRAYANYQAIQASIVVTCELWVMALFLAHVTACVSPNAMLWLTLACIVLGALEVLAVRRESTALVVIALIACVGIMVYTLVLVGTGLRRGEDAGADEERAECGAPTWLCATAHDGSMHVLRELTVTACVLGVISQALVCLLCVRATNAFGRGLRERAFAAGTLGKRGARARFAIDQPFTNFAEDTADGEPRASVEAGLGAEAERGARSSAEQPGTIEPLVASLPVWPLHDDSSVALPPTDHVSELRAASDADDAVPATGSVTGGE